VVRTIGYPPSTVACFWTPASSLSSGFLLGCGTRQKLGVAHLGRTSFDILGDLVKVLGQVSEHLLQVGLPRYLGHRADNRAGGPAKLAAGSIPTSRMT
jgi:hypothetical protein